MQRVARLVTSCCPWHRTELASYRGVSLVFCLLLQARELRARSSSDSFGAAGAEARPLPVARVALGELLVAGATGAVEWHVRLRVAGVGSWAPGS